jgi:hypothetical protein
MECPAHAVIVTKNAKHLNPIARILGKRTSIAMTATSTRGEEQGCAECRVPSIDGVGLLQKAPRRCGGRSLPAAVCEGRTTKLHAYLGATRRAADVFVPHVVARASLDALIPRGDAPAMDETRP